MKLSYLKSLFVFVLICGANSVHAQIVKEKKYKDTIRVACVGNSITYGYDIKDRKNDSYPARLGKLLGENYKVENFGISARTLLSKGDLPYINESIFKDALKFNPHVVIIMLGTNDTKPHNWVHKDEFVQDYTNLVEAFDTLNSKPKIVLCQLVPAFPEQWGINDSTITKDVNPLIIQIAKDLRLPTINLHTPFENKGALFPDKIHPNEEAADLMARIIYENLTVKKKERKYVLSSSFGAK